MATEQQLLTLKTWLEWAGSKLVALPSDRIKPSSYRTYWPDMVKDIYQISEAKRKLHIRVLAPTAEEIDLMDQVLILPSKTEDFQRRRIVQMRLLTHPVTQRNLRTWSEVAKAEHTSVFRVQSIHSQALREIWGKTPDFDLNLISERFEKISVW